MTKRRPVKDTPSPKTNPDRHVGEETLNPLPDDYRERHPEDNAAHSNPEAPGK